MPWVASAGLASQPAVVQLLPSVSAQGVLTSGVKSHCPVEVLQTVLVQASPVQVLVWWVCTQMPWFKAPPASQPAVVQLLPSVSAQGVLTSGVKSHCPVEVLQTVLVQASPVQVLVWWVCTQMPWFKAPPASQPAVVQLLPSVSAQGVLNSGVKSHCPVEVLQTVLVQASPVQVWVWWVWTQMPWFKAPPASQPAEVQLLPSVSAPGTRLCGAKSHCPVEVLQTVLVQASPVQVWVWWVWTQMPWFKA